MILQDLIRNIFLYKGIVSPFLTSWKESFIPPSYLSVNLLKAFEVRFFSTNEVSIEEKNVKALFESSIETYTIVTTKAISLQYFPSEIIIKAMDVASNGSTIITMLMDDRLYEQAATTAKTVSFQLIHSTSSTTGFANQIISSFLFHETHEKREYLGEFSLHHEEIPLMYQKRGGE